MIISRRDFLKYSAKVFACCTLGTLGCSDGSYSGGESNGYVVVEPGIEIPATGRCNTIMIVVDTLRADHLSLAGYGRNTSPNLTEFAKHACTFENAISPCSWTVPSYVSLLTGMHAFNHNQKTTPDGTPVNRTMLPEYLQQEGYRTVRILTNCVVSEYDSCFDNDYWYCYYEGNRCDRASVDQAIEWLSDNDNLENNFFMLIWLFSPHQNYETSTGYLEEFVLDNVYSSSPVQASDVNCSDYGAIWPDDLSQELQDALGPPLLPGGCYQDYRLYVAAYDSNIKYDDQEIGRLFDFLKERELYEETMILLTSDHGENMVDHEPNFAHAGNLYHSLVHVPMMIKFPYQDASANFTTCVRSIDLLPTVFEFLDIDLGSVDGRTLLPLITGNPVDTRNYPCLSYLWREPDNADLFSITRGQYKLIRGPYGDELYDLWNDAEEKENVVYNYPKIYAELLSYLPEV